MGKGKKSMRKFAKQGGVKKAISRRRSAQGKRQAAANRRQERREKKQTSRAESEAALGRTLEKTEGRRGRKKGDDEDAGHVTLPLFVRFSQCIHRERRSEHYACYGQR